MTDKQENAASTVNNCSNCDNCDSDSSDGSTEHSNAFENDEEVYDYDQIEEIGKMSGLYRLDKNEGELFEGHYKSKFIKNKDLGIVDLDKCSWNINCQIIYKKGRVMFKSDIAEDVNIFDLIDLFIKYTYDPCTDLDLDKSVSQQTQMRFGTICPTRKILFIYKNREFRAYGRYIYGFDHQYVKIKNETTTIKFRNPPWDRECDEYVYSFMILNCATRVVEAFGLYR